MSSVALAVKSPVIVWLLLLAVVAPVWRAVCVMRATSGVGNNASPSLSVGVSMETATTCFTNSSILAKTVSRCAPVYRMARYEDTKLRLYFHFRMGFDLGFKVLVIRNLSHMIEFLSHMRNNFNFIALLK